MTPRLLRRAQVLELLQVGSSSAPAAMLGFLAILFASINIFGGFAVTHRMLAMFRKHEATR